MTNRLNSSAMDDDRDLDYIPPPSDSEDIEGAEYNDLNDETLAAEVGKSSDFSVEYEFNANHLSPVWKEFGVIKKRGRKLGALAKRIFCKHCFMDRRLKRYDLIKTKKLKC